MLYFLLLFITLKNKFSLLTLRRVLFFPPIINIYNFLPFVGLFHSNIASCNWNDILETIEPQISYMNYLGIFFIIIIFYWLLYDFLNINKNIFSFIFFGLNILFALFYFKGFIILYEGISDPILLDTLSKSIYYKYVFFSFVSCIIGFGFVVGLKFPKINKSFSFLSFPYLKEEIRTILYVWKDTFMGDWCCYLYKKLNQSFIFCIFYFSIHFIIFYISRTLTLYFLINFIFFKGDFRLIIYCVPLLFIVWLLSFFDYYFKIFREGTLNYLREILHVKHNGILLEHEISQGFVTKP